MKGWWRQLSASLCQFVNCPSTVSLNQVVEELRSEGLRTSLTGNQLTVLESHQSRSSHDPRLFGELSPLTTALRVGYGNNVLPSLNLAQLTLNVLTRATAVLYEKMNGFVHGVSPFGTLVV